MRKKVTILQYRLLHYRVPFFERLKLLLAERGVGIRLIHGQASPKEKEKNDEGFIGWAERVENKYLHIGDKDLCWQPLVSNLNDSNLIIVMQENRLISNYPLLLKRKFGGPLIAYWGHGKNLQSAVPDGFREKWKRMLLSSVDWWFAYTSLTVDYLKKNGFPSERITCLNNSIDTLAFRDELQQVSDVDMQKVRQNFNINPDACLGLYCGSLYPDKKLDFLIGASDIIQNQKPDYHLIVIGDGPSAGDIRVACKSRPWLHWVGMRKGHEKAVFFKMAQIILNPGLVGLHILDSFCAGLPLITTGNAKHSPEIAYLNNGINGIISGNTASEYADAVISLMKNKQRYQSISFAAQEASRIYTIDNMAQNFADGICHCLESR